VNQLSLLHSFGKPGIWFRASMTTLLGRKNEGSDEHVEVKGEEKDRGD
jgi:hypothetical protein